MSLQDFIEDYNYQYTMRVELLLQRCSGDISRFMRPRLNDFELRDVYDSNKDIRMFLPHIGVSTFFHQF